MTQRVFVIKCGVFALFMGSVPGCLNVNGQAVPDASVGLDVELNRPHLDVVSDAGRSPAPCAMTASVLPSLGSQFYSPHALAIVPLNENRVGVLYRASSSTPSNNVERDAGTGTDVSVNTGRDSLVLQVLDGSQTPPPPLVLTNSLGPETTQIFWARFGKLQKRTAIYYSYVDSTGYRIRQILEQNTPGRVAFAFPAAIAAAGYLDAVTSTPESAILSVTTYDSSHHRSLLHIQEIAAAVERADGPVVYRELVQYAAIDDPASSVPHHARGIGAATFVPSVWLALFQNASGFATARPVYNDTRIQALRASSMNHSMSAYPSFGAYQNAAPSDAGAAHADWHLQYTVVPYVAGGGGGTFNLLLVAPDGSLSGDVEIGSGFGTLQELPEFRAFPALPGHEGEAINYLIRRPAMGDFVAGQIERDAMSVVPSSQTSVLAMKLPPGSMATRLVDVGLDSRIADCARRVVVVENQDHEFLWVPISPD